MISGAFLQISVLWVLIKADRVDVGEDLLLAVPEHVVLVQDMVEVLSDKLASVSYSKKC